MSLLAKKPADEIREMWQSRCLRATTGKLRKVMITALAKEYPAALVALMKVTFPGFIDFDRPFFTSYAAIYPSGRLVCEMMDKDGTKRLVAAYRDQNEFLYELRTLADTLKLNDADRVEMFTVLQRWVASDRRYDIHNEKKLAS